MWWNGQILFAAAPLTLAAMTLAGYLLGSIPFGLLFTRMAGFGDIRKIGSGNIGATNVLRTGNKLLALATLLCDGGKGALAAIAAGLIAGPIASALAGAAALIGHIYPVWLKFKGGKGFATFLATLIALSWPAGLASSATWILTALVFRYSSLATLIATALSPLFLCFIGPAWLALPVLACALLVIWRHKDNIRRLINRTEPKIGSKAGAVPLEPAKS